MEGITMNKQVEKIKAEIKRIIGNIAGVHLTCEYNNGFFKALHVILNFIDTLPEEPVSEDLEEAGRNYADNEEYGDDVYLAIKAAFKAGAKWQSKKEQDIIETAEDHAFLAGANWQKEQEMQDRLKSDNTVFQKIYEKGKADMKEQMLKDAVDADAIFDYYDNQNRLYVSILATDVLTEKYGIKDKDKIKIIIVKEDKQ